MARNLAEFAQKFDVDDAGIGRTAFLAQTDHMVLLAKRRRHHDLVAQRHHRAAHRIVGPGEQRQRSLRLSDELGVKLQKFLAGVVAQNLVPLAQRIEDVTHDYGVIADAFGVVHAVQQHRNAPGLFVGDGLFHEVREIRGDVALTLVDLAFDLVERFGKFKIVRVGAVIEFERAVYRAPRLAEHLAERAGGLMERHVRRIEKNRFEPAVFHLGLANREHALAKRRKRPDERNEHHGGDDVEKRMGVGDLARQLAAGGEVAHQIEERRLTVDHENKRREKKKRPA